MTFYCDITMTRAMTFKQKYDALCANLRHELAPTCANLRYELAPDDHETGGMKQLKVVIL